MQDSKLEDLLAKCDDIPEMCMKKSKDIFHDGMKISSSDYYWFDQFVIGALNRTLNLSRAFSSAMRDHNFFVAAPLLRLNIDTAIRMYASQLTDKTPNDFAEYVIKGGRIDELYNTTPKGKKNKFHDNYLVQELESKSNFEELVKVYKASNSYVHLSTDIVRASFRINLKDELVQATVGPHDTFIPNHQKIIVAHYFYEVTLLLLSMVGDWVEFKKKHGPNSIDEA